MLIFIIPILVIFIFYGIYLTMQIVDEIVMSKKCPTILEISQVVLGRVNKNSKLHHRVIAHLGLCDKCRSQVDEINNREIE